MIRTTETWHAGLVLARTLDEILALNATLEPPSPGSLQGDYAGYAHLGPDAGSATIVRSFVRDRAGKGTWLGKSFGPLIDGVGVGCNRLLQKDGSTRRCEPFRTYEGESLVDGRPTLILDYTGYRHAPGRAGFIDEVRALGDGWHLLLATTPDGMGGRTPPAVMALQGPVTA